MSYHDATQRLGDQGFNKDEIAHASYQFPYSTEAAEATTSHSSSLDHAFAKGVVHQEAIDAKKKDATKSLALGFLAPGFIGRYFSTKAVGEFAGLRELRDQDTLGGPKTPVKEGGRVSQRNRAIRYFAILGLVSLVLAVPALAANARQFFETLEAIFRNPEQISPIGTSLSMWPAVVLVASVAFVSLLFFARKESTIIAGTYGLLLLELSVFIIIAVMCRSPLPLIIGALAVLPNYWISRRVGILSHL